MSATSAGSAVRCVISAEADRVLILANPVAGARAGHLRVERLIAALKSRRLSPELLPTLDDLARRTETEKSTGRLRAVVAAGGDGTVNQIINRIAPAVPIALLPGGTENLLAKFLDMPFQPEEVAEVVAVGVTVRLDAGNASGRKFLLMIGCGFDAEIVRRVEAERRGNIRRWNYLKPIWDAIRSYDYPEFRITCGKNGQGDHNLGDNNLGDHAPGANCEGEEPIRARFAFVTNVPRYALGLQFAPDAVGDDGLLDVCAFRRGSFWHGLNYLGQVIMGRHARHTDCIMTRARRLRIESDRPVPYEVDGDFGGFLPVDVEILPEQVTVLVPPAWPGTKGVSG